MNVFRLELRNMRRSTILSAGFMSLIIALMLAFFPAMQTESMMALAGAKLEGISPILLQALGLSQMLDFSVISYYFGYVIQFVGLAVMVTLLQQAISLLIKEESDGTIEFLYAKPISRGGLFAQKALAYAVATFLMLAAYAVVTFIGYLLISDLPAGEAMREALLIYAALLFAGWVYASLGILLSTLIKSSKSASTLSIAIVFGTFLLGMLSTLVPNLSFLYWLSPMDWIKMDKLMQEGIAARELAVGVIVSIACLLIAWQGYRRKDLLI